MSFCITDSYRGDEETDFFFQAAALFQNISVVQMTKNDGTARVDGTARPTEPTGVDAEDAAWAQSAAIDVGRSVLEMIFLSIVIDA